MSLYLFRAALNCFRDSDISVLCSSTFADEVELEEDEREPVDGDGLDDDEDEDEEEGMNSFLNPDCYSFCFFL